MTLPLGLSHLALKTEQRQLFSMVEHHFLSQVHIVVGACVMNDSEKPKELHRLRFTNTRYSRFSLLTVIVLLDHGRSSKVFCSLIRRYYPLYVQLVTSTCGYGRLQKVMGTSYLEVNNTQYHNGGQVTPKLLIQPKATEHSWAISGMN